MRVKGTAISMQVTVQFDRQKLHPQCDWPILRLRFCTHHFSGPSSWSMLASGVLLRSNFQDDLRRRHRFVGRNARCKHVFPGPAEYLLSLRRFQRIEIDNGVENGSKDVSQPHRRPARSSAPPSRLAYPSTWLSAGLHPHPCLSLHWRHDWLS